MEPNEITTNEEIVETTTTVEVTTTENSNSGLGMAALGGLVVLGGVMAHKYIIKPIAARIRNRALEKKKAATQTQSDVIDVEFKEELAEEPEE
jgi:hypothetical protein